MCVCVRVCLYVDNFFSRYGSTVSDDDNNDDYISVFFHFHYLVEYSLNYNTKPNLNRLSFRVVFFCFVLFWIKVQKNDDDDHMDSNDNLQPLVLGLDCFDKYTHAIRSIWLPELYLSGVYNCWILLCTHTHTQNPNVQL